MVKNNFVPDALSSFYVTYIYTLTTNRDVNVQKISIATKDCDQPLIDTSTSYNFTIEPPSLNQELTAVKANPFTDQL